MKFGKHLGLALAFTSSALAPEALAQANDSNKVSGQMRCDVATSYILQKVQVEVRDEAQVQCSASATIDTKLGLITPNVWNTTDLDGGFSAETDLGINYKPEKESPWTLRYSKYIINGDNNDIDRYGVDYSLGKYGSLSAEILDPATGETGRVIGYNAPKFKHHFAKGDLTHGPTVSYARRAGSGDDLASLRYNAQWTRPVTDSVNFVLSGQFAKPIYTTGAVDSDPLAQLNIGLSKKF